MNIFGAMLRKFEKDIFLYLQFHGFMLCLQFSRC